MNLGLEINIWIVDSNFLVFLTDRRTSGRFTAELRDVKFLFDSMPQVEAHRITILSLTVKRKKRKKTARKFSTRHYERSYNSFLTSSIKNCVKCVPVKRAFVRLPNYFGCASIG